jgi:hypothetical protein
MSETVKCHLGYYIVGIATALFGIWQGWTMRDQPDLDMAASFAGVAACWAVIAIGKGKL